MPLHCPRLWLHDYVISKRMLVEAVQEYTNDGAYVRHVFTGMVVVDIQAFYIALDLSWTQAYEDMPLHLELPNGRRFACRCTQIRPVSVADGCLTADVIATGTPIEPGEGFDPSAD